MRSTSKRVALGIAGLALIAGISSVAMGPAIAHGDDSRVTFNTPEKNLEPGDSTNFFGRLRNAHGRCEGGETIELVHRGSGVVDTDRTDGEGEFVLKAGPFDPQDDRGRYFARYRGTGRFGYGNGHQCGADKSGNIRIR